MFFLSSTETWFLRLPNIILDDKGPLVTLWMGLEGVKKTLWIITEVFPVDEKINLPLAKPYDFTFNLTI